MEKMNSKNIMIISSLEMKYKFKIVNLFNLQINGIYKKKLRNKKKQVNKINQILIMTKK